VIKQFTSDNPRNEDPEVITEMEKGVGTQNYKKTLSITDRKQAIKLRFNWLTQ
jgi:UDP-N-acetylmuramoyl-L-alanyl-D-glutamate--2,6-diaminopimelate ligase